MIGFIQENPLITAIVAGLIVTFVGFVANKIISRKTLSDIVNAIVKQWCEIVSIIRRKITVFFRGLGNALNQVMNFATRNAGIITLCFAIVAISLAFIFTSYHYSRTIDRLQNDIDSLNEDLQGVNEALLLAEENLQAAEGNLRTMEEKLQTAEEDFQAVKHFLQAALQRIEEELQATDSALQAANRRIQEFTNPTPGEKPYTRVNLSLYNNSFSKDVLYTNSIFCHRLVATEIYSNAIDLSVFFECGEENGVVKDMTLWVGHRFEFLCCGSVFFIQMNTPSSFSLYRYVSIP